MRWGEGERGRILGVFLLYSFPSRIYAQKYVSYFFHYCLQEPYFSVLFVVTASYLGGSFWLLFWKCVWNWMRIKVKQQILKRWIKEWECDLEWWGERKRNEPPTRLNSFIFKMEWKKWKHEIVKWRGKESEWENGRTTGKENSKRVIEKCS